MSFIRVVSSSTIALAPRGSRQSRALALLRTKRYDNDSNVLTAVPRCCGASERLAKRAVGSKKRWLQTQMTGDAWCEYVAFETHTGEVLE